MTPTHTYDLLIIGAGAAGVFAAIHAAEAAKQHGNTLRIAVLEAGQKPLGKVKISGGGRCNVTHHCMDPAQLLTHYPRSHRAMENNFRQFGPTETIAWFTQHGVPLKTEADGRMFPTSDDSQSIIDCLLGQLHHHNIPLMIGQPVQSIQQHSTHYTLITPSQRFTTRGIILASGSSASGQTLATHLGLTTVAPCPSLFTFNTQRKDLHALSGLSMASVAATLQFDPTLSVDGKRQKSITTTGPVLLTHWGFSGPAILKLSALGARALAATQYQATLTMDWCPHTHTEALRQALLGYKATQGDKLLKNTPLATQPNAAFPKRLWEALLSDCDTQHHTQLLATPWREQPNKALHTLATHLKHWHCPIQGKGPFKEEFVTAGGVALNQLKLAHFSAKHVPHVWAIGEAVNIDGVTGGFNFQHAWTSGYLAGTHAAQQLLTTATTGLSAN